VAVLYGGRSGEHEISVRSAKSVIEALDPVRYEAVPLFIDKQGKWEPRAISPEPGSNPGIDVVFPVLHGTFGEDGTLQGLLEMAGLPYVGAGVFASAASMDKDHFKRLCMARGLPVVEYITVSRATADADAIMAAMHPPVFVKPANLGSSVGISKAKDHWGLSVAVAEALRYDHKVIVERAITGQEVECAVLGNESAEASTPCEILPSREFYDYEDKYLLDAARIELPARLSDEKTAEVRRLAVECFKAVECSGMARVDFFVESGTGAVYINEINTIPGFTSISMYPKMWEHAGLPMSHLIDRLIELALERHTARQALRFER